MSENIQIKDHSEARNLPIPSEKNTTSSSIIFFLLCAIPVFAAVAFGGVDVWALGVFSLAAGAILILWTLDAWRKKELDFNTNLLQIPLLGLILLGLIQLLPFGSANMSGDLLAVAPVRSLSIDPYTTKLAVIKLCVLLIFFAAAYTFINNRNRLQKIVSTVIVSGTTMAFFGILQRLANPEAIYGLRPVAQAIPFSSFVNQHHFAGFMEMTLGLTLALIFGRAVKNDKRIFYIFAAVIMGIAVIFTSSRGGMISLLGVTGFVILTIFLQKRKDASDDLDEDEPESNFRRNIFLFGGGLSFLLILFGSVLLLGADESLVRGIGLANPQNDITSGRTHFWNVALQIFKDHPIIGAGLGSFGTAYPNYDTWNGTFRVENAHNDYLQILADAGILGFLCVVSFVYLFFKQTLRIIAETENTFRRSAAIGAAAGCFGIFLHSFFDFPLRTTSNAFFFLILIVIATGSINLPKKYRRKRYIDGQL